MKEKILNYLYNRFYNKYIGLFYITKNDKTIHSYVNGNIVWILFLLGEEKKSNDLFESSIKSNLYDKKTSLLRYSIQEEGVFNSDKNLGANVAYLYSSLLLNKKDIFDKLLENIENTFFDKNEGLYFRSTVDNKLFLVQPNLWLVKIFYEIGEKTKAKELYDSVINRFYDDKLGLLTSKSGIYKDKYKDVYIFPDDNALLVSISNLFNEDFSEKIAENIFNSEVFDDKKRLFLRKLNITKNEKGDSNSIYKNALCSYLLKDSKNPKHKKLTDKLFNELFNIENMKFSEDYSDSLFFGLLAYNSVK